MAIKVHLPGALRRLKQTGWQIYFIVLLTNDDDAKRFVSANS